MIHHFWHDDNPPPLPSPHLADERVLWTPNTLADLHPDHAWHFIDHPRHAANVARWLLLRDFGGLWLDMDVSLTRDPRDGNAFIPCDETGNVHSAVIHFPEPGHAFTHLMCHRIDRLGPSSGPTHLRSGDGVLAHAYKKLWIYDGLHVGHPPVHLRTFNPLIWE